MTHLNTLIERYESQFQSKIKKFAFPENRIDMVRANVDSQLIGVSGTCWRTMDIAVDAVFKYSSNIVPRGKAFRKIVQLELGKHYEC